MKIHLKCFICPTVILCMYASHTVIRFLNHLSNTYSLFCIVVLIFHVCLNLSSHIKIGPVPKVGSRTDLIELYVYGLKHKTFVSAVIRVEQFMCLM